MSTYLDLVKDTMRELGVIDAEEDPGASEQAFLMDRLNQIFDRFNSYGLLSFVDEYTTPILGSAIAPHTIGPDAATFTVTLRPDAILSASIRSGAAISSTRVRVLTIRDERWWQSVSTPGTTGSPTDLFYRPDFPNGELHFWPVPDGAFYFDFWARHQYAQGDLATTFSFPPGWKSALMKALAIEVAPAFNVQPSPITMAGAASALNALITQHGKTYRHTPDGSMPGSNVGYFDFNTRSWR